ncbi:hypothetical protein PRVXH_002146 [Proteinivorax hydrogeniformans]|uniref:Uncharacterized protein n=1 Tax=Proteinivorax hydrogeniformans TaxID=1826727 RepID=A0AAU8HS06_9FIRM
MEALANSYKLQLDERIKCYEEEYLKLWNTISYDFPSLQMYSKAEKMLREAKIKKTLIQHKSKLKNLRKIESEEDEKTVFIIKKVIEEAIGFHKEQLDLIYNEGFYNNLINFEEEAQKFIQDNEPSKGIALRGDVYQATRTVMISAMMQLMFDKPISITPSLFAINMIYIYTDNYIDDPKTDKKSKMEFSKKISKYLLGERVLPQNEKEEIIFKLIDLFRLEYQQEEYEDLYNSLYYLHKAQEDSFVKQQHEINTSSVDDMLKITMEKGGVFAIADGYLIKGHISYEAEKFCYGLGTFLQFIDDLQDVQSDLQTGNMTVFSKTIVEGDTLDNVTNKAIQFIKETLDSEIIVSHKQKLVRDFVIHSCTYLIFETIAINSKYYSDEYVEQAEKHMPLSLGFLKNLRSTLEEHLS